MATSDDLLNSFDSIKNEIELLKDAVIDSNNHLLNITKMLTMLNMSSARNARANDLSWKLNATNEQMNVLKSNQVNLQQEEANVTKINTS